MKKSYILAIIAIVFSVCAVDAQDNPELVNKKGNLILPQAGDFAIGIEASPFFSYFGNLLNATIDNQSPSLNFLETSTIYGKYFVAKDRAFRARLEITTMSSVNKQYIVDDYAVHNDPLSNAQVVDKYTRRNSNVVLGLGYEYRRGRTRLQGYYGFEGMLHYQSTVDLYEYGNPYSELFPNPTDFNFGNNLLSDGSRKLEHNYGKTFGVGAGAFVGIEYFILPAISIGGELAWNIIYNRTGKSKQVSEKWNGSQTEENTQMLSPGNRSLASYTANPQAGIFFMFHF